MKNLIKYPLKVTNALEQLWNDSFGDIILNNIFDELKTTKSFPVNIAETDTKIRVIAEMPGINKDDISVDVKDRILTIKAEKKQEKFEEGEGIIHQESYYGAMQRSFAINDNIDPDTISASFIDGILKVTMEKKTENFKKINID